MTKRETIKTTDPDFSEYCKLYMDRLDQVVKRGRADDLVEQGSLGLLWHKAVPDLPRPMSCPDLELVACGGSENAASEDERVVAGWAFFCHRLGCLCTPMRPDLPGEYPEACPESSIEDEIRWGQPEEEEVCSWDDWAAFEEDYAEDWNPDRDHDEEEASNDGP